MTKYDQSTKIEDQPQLIKTREDFLKFLNTLLMNYQKSKADWENNTVESFLNGMIGFTEDASGYYENIDEDVNTERPSWRLFADILLAARIYE